MKLMMDCRFCLFKLIFSFRIFVCSHFVLSSVGKKQLFWFFTHVTSIFIGVRECFAFQRWLSCRQRPNVLFVRLAFVCSPTGSYSSLARFYHYISYEDRNFILTINLYLNDWQIQVSNATLP